MAETAQQDGTFPPNKNGLIRQAIYNIEYNKKIQQESTGVFFQ